MPETEKWNKNGFHTHWFHNFFSHFSMIFKNPWTDPKSVKKIDFFSVKPEPATIILVKQSLVRCFRVFLLLTVYFQPCEK